MGDQSLGVAPKNGTENEYLLVSDQVGPWNAGQLSLTLRESTFFPCTRTAGHLTPAKPSLSTRANKEVSECSDQRGEAGLGD